MEKVKEFFNALSKMFANFNDWLQTTFLFDEKIVNFYQAAIAPLAEWIKMVGLVVAILLIIVGFVVVLKKAYKLILTLLIIGVVAGLVLFFLIQ
ncbi:MAG: hypothetical protein WC939_00065 [Acholeplasmataceae bacterium]